LLLRRAVAEIAIAERHEQRLRQVVAAGGPLEAELALAKEHRETCKSITALMTALRATPRSHVELRAARSAFDRSPSGPRPWEFVLEGENLGETPGDAGRGGGNGGGDGNGEE
jgi:hypothetical protein